MRHTDYQVWRFVLRANLTSNNLGFANTPKFLSTLGYRIWHFQVWLREESIDILPVKKSDKNDSLVFD